MHEPAATRSLRRTLTCRNTSGACWVHFHGWGLWGLCRWPSYPGPINSIACLAVQAVFRPETKTQKSVSRARCTRCTHGPSTPLKPRAVNTAICLPHSYVSFISFHSIPFHFNSIQFHSNSISFHCIPFHSISFHSNLFLYSFIHSSVHPFIRSSIHSCILFAMGPAVRLYSNIFRYIIEMDLRLGQTSFL